MTLIRQRRRNANRLGFAVHLAYLRFPGECVRPKELSWRLSLIVWIDPDGFRDYA